MNAGALMLAGALLGGGPAPAAPPPSAPLAISPSAAAAVVPASARYRFRGDSPWKVVAPREEPGYRIVLSSPDGRLLEATVSVAPAAGLEARLPIDRASLPPEARAALEEGGEPSLALDRAARLTAGAATTVGEAVRRAVDFTSRRVRYDAPDGERETAAGTLARMRGSCVGRSLLAAELLRRAGVPARQVTGLLAARDASELTPDTRPYFSGSLGGVRHRWIEFYLPGRGWVPADPGGLAAGVTARHVALVAAPGTDFGVEPLPAPDGKGATR